MNMDQYRDILTELISGLNNQQARIKIFERIRDIPYGSIGSRDSFEVYNRNKGTCSGKHALLKNLFLEMGYDVKDYICIHRFNDLKVKFPPKIKKILSKSEILDPHNFIKIKIAGKWVTIDCTWEKGLEKFGFIVNKWGGIKDMKLCVKPIQIFEINDPLESKIKEVSKLPFKEKRLLFLKELTNWLEEIRK